MEIIAQGTTGWMKFLHPDYLSAASTWGGPLNLFDNVLSQADALFILFLVTISLISIVVAYYIISNHRKS